MAVCYVVVVAVAVTSGKTASAPLTSCDIFSQIRSPVPFIIEDGTHRHSFCRYYIINDLKLMKMQAFPSESAIGLEPDRNTVQRRNETMHRSFHSFMIDMRLFFLPLTPRHRCHRTGIPSIISIICMRQFELVRQYWRRALCVDWLFVVQLRT